jgi:hypothetical protein
MVIKSRVVFPQLNIKTDHPTQIFQLHGHLLPPNNSHNSDVHHFASSASSDSVLAIVQLHEFVGTVND